MTELATPMKQSFSLIELIFVIIIIGVLSGISFTGAGYRRSVYALKLKEAR
jgi:prepilin-type N-terminal cleavage/methylation domain-containing protein